jgi:PAS domain S-box-containing protein
MNSPAKIVIVEDEAIVAMDLEQQLLDFGYSVPAILASGEEAVQRIIKDPPDLVLMDIQLRDIMDGISAMKEIKRSVQVPVVYLTAYADRATLYRARETEPHGYLVKPFNDETLRTTVEMALHKFQSEQKLHNYASELEQKNILLQLLNRLGKSTGHVKNRRDLLRTACSGLVEALKLPYAFALSIGKSSHKNSILYECDERNPNSVATHLTPEAHLFCRNHFLRDKPWIIQDVYHDPCLQILNLYKANTLKYQLFVLPLVVEGDVVGIIGLGANQIEDISAQEIRAAWSVVSEIVIALESINAVGSRQRILDVFFNSNISIILTDNAGIVEFANPAFEKNTGFLLHEIVGHTLISIPLLAGNVNESQHDALETAIASGVNWFGSLECHTGDGISKRIQVALWPIENSSISQNYSGDFSENHTVNTSEITNYICFFQVNDV